MERWCAACRVLLASSVPKHYDETQTTTICPVALFFGNVRLTIEAFLVGLIIRYHRLVVRSFMGWIDGWSSREKNQPVLNESACTNAETRDSRRTNHQACPWLTERLPLCVLVYGEWYVSLLLALRDCFCMTPVCRLRATNLSTVAYLLVE